MTRAVVLSAVRTPVGRYGGGLAGVRPDDLAAIAVAAAVERAGVPPAEIEDVWLGCANQAGEDNRNVARFAALLAGLPDSVPGVTVNRLCASGLSAVAQALHPELGAVYLGSQGDLWDAQHDMAAAFIGSLLCLGVAVLARRSSDDLLTADALDP